MIDEYKLPLDEKTEYNIEDIKNVIDILFSENGCPWDKSRTFDDIKIYLLEETYEAIEAINKKDYDGMAEELGDVLFQILFLCKLGEIEGKFDFSDITDKITRKMISRHTHIFGDENVESNQDIENLWQRNKEKENKNKEKINILNTIPKELPGLLRTEKVLKKAEKEDIISLSLAQSMGEIEELNKKLDSTNGNKNDIIGLYLIHLVNISNKLGLNAEFVLTNAIETFINKHGNIKD